MTRKKIGDIINTIFGWGIYICLFAGGITFFGFLFAVIIGGGTGEAIAVFLHKQYFPIIIRLASFIIILGLIGMYLNKEQALSLVTDKKEADEELERFKAEEK